MTLIKRILFLIISCCGLFNPVLLAQQAPMPSAERWVDSVYNQMSLQQRIGQLLMLRANSTQDPQEIKQLQKYITEYGIGGVCFFKGGPVSQAILTNRYQKLSQVPLFVAMDAEWGLGMRLDSTISFPRQMTLGAMDNEALISEAASVIGRQLKRVGVNISFSPVADINNNPLNPVINVRSFGEQKEAVARKAILFMQALQSQGLLTVAKHFPGHGDTDTDSHLALPVIHHDAATIDTLDLFPFKRLIEQGIDGIMVGHMNIPALENSPDLPASLSYNVISKLLKGKLNFSGLIFSDALDMKGVSGYSSKGEVELKALMAGCDILLLPSSVEKTVDAIELALTEGRLTEKELESHCKKVLLAKFRAGLIKADPVEVDYLKYDLHGYSDEALNLKLYEDAVTLVSNQKGLIPLQALDTLRLACITIGYDKPSALDARCDSYAAADHFYIDRDASATAYTTLSAQLAKYNLLLIQINNTIPNPGKCFGISTNCQQWVDGILPQKACVLSLFSLPYAANLFINISQAKALLIAYQDNEDAYEAVMQGIFGANALRGRLPVGINAQWPAGYGLRTAAIGCIRFNPFEVKWPMLMAFKSIDSLAMEGLAKKVYPGCEVVVLKDGNVAYQKAFGYTDYVNHQAVNPTLLYDLASVTKIAATTPAAMWLYDRGQLDPAWKLSERLPLLKHSNKENLTIRDVMMHQSGLVAWVPFYKYTLVNGKPDPQLYAKQYSAQFPVPVADSMFGRLDMPRKLIDSVIHSPLLKKEFRYSDLGFMLMQQYIERVSSEKLNYLMDREFYRPMGLKTMGYLPLQRFMPGQIAPTEDDKVFRQQLLRGYVHDPAAAMMGGVSGHAGLFSDALDLAKLMQMLLQNGYYGGRNYLKPETVKRFTSYQDAQSRRGLGFDKPQRTPGDSGPACDEAPPSSYGHTGFTGTFAWVDPDNGWVLIFLSNRVNPDAEPNLLAKYNLRTRIQSVLYRPMGK